MTNDAAISEDVRRFVLTSVPSVPYLEALLLLRARPQQGCDAAELARRLYVPEANARELLDALCAAHIAVREGEVCHYAPHTAELRDVLDALARAYSTRLIEVTHLIHSKTLRQAQQFADAFKLRKE
ncbi:MAG TPA: hypothetical protein VFS42_04470 [Burkholderiaceae bacterium]|nr:hypothetical protein [Burkholderiaceae bacterium]